MTGNLRDLDPGRVNCQTRGGVTPACAMHEFFFENLRKPARVRRYAGAMRQFPTGQVNSNKFSTEHYVLRVHM
jgi:hypothetical protein